MILKQNQRKVITDLLTSYNWFKVNGVTNAKQQENFRKLLRTIELTDYDEHIFNYIYDIVKSGSRISDNKWGPIISMLILKYLIDDEYEEEVDEKISNYIVYSFIDCKCIVYEQNLQSTTDYCYEFVTNKDLINDISILL